MSERARWEAQGRPDCYSECTGCTNKCPGLAHWDERAKELQVEEQVPDESKQREWASEDQDARAALREATKQEGWFDEHFITRVIERLDGQGYRITKKG